MSKVGRSAMDRSCLARLRIAATGYANPNARAVDLRTTLRVALRAHSPRNNRPERNENCVTHVAGQICYLCCRLLTAYATFSHKGEAKQLAARSIQPKVIGSKTLPRLT